MLRSWKEIGAFQTQLRLTGGCPRFTFLLRRTLRCVDYYLPELFKLIVCLATCHAAQRLVQAILQVLGWKFSDASPGLVHCGLLLAFTNKDIIPRCWRKKGFHAAHRFGWDTYEVPIEYDIDKKLGISGEYAVSQMGLERYSDECRAIVVTEAT